MNTLYFGDCLDVLKELNNENNINLDVANCDIKFKKTAPFFKGGFRGFSLAHSLDKENGEEELF